MSLLKLAICLLSLGALVAVAQANGLGFKHYRVPGTPTKNSADALRVLRVHTHPRETNERRCKLITSLLYKLDLAPMNQFDISKVAKLKTPDLDNEARHIPIDNLVKYYIKAVDELTSGSDLDLAIVDVTGCMSALFGSNNMKVRKILENENLQKTIAQWQQITNQKTDFFLDPQYKHPTLKLESLTKPVYATLLKLAGNDKDLVESKFYSAEQEAARVQQARSEIAKTKDIFEQFFDTVFKDDAKWTDESLCHVYSDAVKAAKGSISDEEALAAAKSIQAEIDTNGLAPHESGLDEASIDDMVDIIRKSLEFTPKDKLWQDLAGCIQSHSGYESASALLNSKIIVDKLEEVKRAELAAAA